MPRSPRTKHPPTLPRKTLRVATFLTRTLKTLKMTSVKDIRLFVFCRHNSRTGEAKRDRGQVITFDYRSSVSRSLFSRRCGGRAGVDAWFRFHYVQRSSSPALLERPGDQQSLTDAIVARRSRCVKQDGSRLFSCQLLQSCFLP